MRREGDGSQLSSLPRDIRSQRDTRSQGASRVSFSREPPPGTAVFQKTPPQERSRDLP